MPLTIETPEELFERHGDHAFDGERHSLFEDGARYCHTSRQRWEPSEDEHELAKAKVEYSQQRLANAEHELARCSSYIVAQLGFAAAGAGPMPPKEAYADRIRLKRAVLRAQQGLDRAREALQIDPQTILRREVEERRRAHRQAAVDMLNELMAEG